MKRWPIRRTPVAAAAPSARLPGALPAIFIATSRDGGFSSTSSRYSLRCRARSSSDRVAGVTSTRRNKAALSSASREAISIALSSSAFSGFRERFGNAPLRRRPISRMRSSRPAGADTARNLLLVRRDSPDPARRHLLRNKPFVALCAARAVSATGDQVAAVALVLLIAKDHPATAVGGLLLAESLPMLLSTHAGVIADRFERRRLMIGCQLGQAVIFAAVTIWLPPYFALLALLVVASFLGTLLRSATQVAVQATVPEGQLMSANALLGVALYGSVILGPAIGGALAGLAGPRLALAVDTVTFLVSAATLLLLPLLPRVA